MSSSKWRNRLSELGFFLPEDKTEVLLKCPFHDDIRPSLSINLEKQLWICFAGCGQGALQSFFTRFLTEFGIGSYDYDFDDFELDWQEHKPQTVCKTIDSIFLEKIFQMGKYPDWIFERGFSESTLHRWGCGCNPHTNSLVIPARNEAGNLVGWISRCAPNKREKYLYMSKLKTSLFLFGLDRFLASSYIIIVEGPLDAMWLDQFGYPGVAILGTHFSSRQQEILYKQSFGEIVLCLDNDEAGRKAEKEIFVRLKSMCPTSRIRLPSNFVDIQDVRDDELLKAIIEQRSVMQL